LPSKVDVSDAGRTLEEPRLSFGPGQSGRSQVTPTETARMMREVRVAHVELSLSGAFVPQARTPAESEFVSSIDRWAATVWQAVEPCLVIDTAFRIVAVSPSASELLGLGKGLDAVGQPLLGGDGSLRLIDFTAGGGDLTEQEIEKIPPLLALTSERLARGLMRVQPTGEEGHLTVDAIASPLSESGRVAASLTFFSAIRY
jgi:PAS domain-containing protein